MEKEQYKSWVISQSLSVLERKMKKFDEERLRIEGILNSNDSKYLILEETEFKLRKNCKTIELLIKTKKDSKLLNKMISEVETILYEERVELKKLKKQKLFYERIYKNINKDIKKAVKAYRALYTAVIIHVSRQRERLGKIGAFGVKNLKENCLKLNLNEFDIFSSLDSLDKSVKQIFGVNYKTAPYMKCICCGEIKPPEDFRFKYKENESSNNVWAKLAVSGGLTCKTCISRDNNSYSTRCEKRRRRLKYLEKEYNINIHSGRFCSREEFAYHMESQWRRLPEELRGGYSINFNFNDLINLRRERKIHWDHIITVCRMKDLIVNGSVDKCEVRINHFSNLRPLEAKKNMERGASCTKFTEYIGKEEEEDILENIFVPWCV